MKCPKGMIIRNGYHTRSYTRKNGTRVKSKKIKSKCIKSRGLPGKTSLRYRGSKKGIGKLKSGELGKHGYHSIKNMGQSSRHIALKRAINDYGVKKILKKLNAIRVYQKNTSPKISKLFYEDMRWIRKKYDDEFKGQWKSSALFK
jgi:hypothetical protein